MHSLLRKSRSDAARKPAPAEHAPATLAPPDHEPPAPAERVAAAQRSIGNQQVSRVLQPKLAINQPGDPLEREADRIAEEVTSGGRAAPVSAATSASGTRAAVQRKCSCGGTCASCQEEEETLHRKEGAGAAAAGVAGTAPPVVHEVLGSSGQPMDTASRNYFEPRFGRDFSQVRIHAGPRATESARAIQALGYTVGSHIVLDGSRYGTGPAPARLMAHELAHVVQQGHAQAPPGVIQRQTPGGGGGIPGVIPVGNFGNLGVSRDPTRRALLDSERASIDAYLALHQVVLIRKENRAWFDGQRTTVSFVVAQVRRAAGILLADDDVIADYIDSQFYRNRLSLSMRPSLAPNAPSKPWSYSLEQPGAGILQQRENRIRELCTVYPPLCQPDQQPPQIVGPPEAVKAIDTGRKQIHQTLIGGAVNVGWHAKLVGGGPASPSRDVAIQFQVADNALFHKQNASGPEVQRQIQFSYNLTTGAIQITGGVQASLVLALFNGALQFSAFTQLLLGLAVGTKPPSLAGVAQPSVGGQIAVQLGPAQLSAQVTRSLTVMPGAETTKDVNFTPGLQLTIPF